MRRFAVQPDNDDDDALTPDTRNERQRAIDLDNARMLKLRVRGDAYRDTLVSERINLRRE